MPVKPRETRSGAANAPESIHGPAHPLAAVLRRAADAVADAGWTEHRDPDFRALRDLAGAVEKVPGAVLTEMSNQADDEACEMDTLEAADPRVAAAWRAMRDLLRMLHPKHALATGGHTTTEHDA